MEVGLVAQDKAHSAIFIVKTTTATRKPSETAYKICVKDSAPAAKPGISELGQSGFRIVRVTPVPPSPALPL